MNDDALAREWAILQTQCYGYERNSLLIKLLAIALVAVAVLLRSDAQLLLGGIVAIVWFQDAIWKTFQHRIATRILVLEQALGNTGEETASDAGPYQLHTEFQAQRQQGGALGQFLSQAVRPTVAFPYVVLLGLLGLTMLLPG